jgi:putative transposase
MDNISTVITPALATYLIGLLYRNTRTRCVSLALLCARVSHDTLRRVLYRKIPWSRRLWEAFAQGLVEKGGYLVIEDTSWERFTRVAEAVSWVWSSSVGQPVWGMQVVLLLWTDGKWKVPIGIRLWRQGGPSKVELAIGLLSQARRCGVQPQYVLFDSWYAAAQILNLLEGWGWQYVTRLKSNRKLDKTALRTTWPHRYGQAQGKLRGVHHPGLVVKDGRRYWGTNATTLTPREVKAHYARRQQIEETFRVLKQEFGWGGCSCQKQQAQWAHLHLGLYALVLTQRTALARHQTMYAFRQSLF